MRRVTGPADFSCTRENSPVSAATRSKEPLFVGRSSAKSDNTQTFVTLAAAKKEIIILYKKKKKKILRERIVFRK